MIKILPLKDIEILKELNAKEATNAQLAFCLYDGEQIDGYILYNVTGDCAELLLVRADDNAMIDGLIRATLASLYDFGINKATFSDKFDLNLLREFKILKQEETMMNSIHSLLYQCEGCKGGCC